jgi:maltooligosyltrehalose trehalohydrolase
MPRKHTYISPPWRRLPIGAELVPAEHGRGVHFRVWAPKRQRVDVELDGQYVELEREEGGYHSGTVERAKVGDRYRFRVDGENAFPDPASRFQPDGPHGASQIVDPSMFRWTDDGWRGVSVERPIMYEMHVGTCTPEGTWAAAARQLPELADLGVDILEIMPIAEFPGRFGWGYDAVDLFAPYHMYGAPDDFRAFVNAAHAEGLAVILDVVYNHVGPDGNYLPQYSDAYFSTRHKTDWGQAINYDGRDSAGVREFVTSNARHWISEYHLDGLRLDATQNIYDDSTPHILEAIGVAARAAAGGRQLHLVAESEHQDARIVRPRDHGGFALDQIWCDDFHHAAMVAATGRREAYYTDYRGRAQEFVSAVKHGILYQGQRYTWQKQRRGAGAWDIAPEQCVFYLENHDQVANSRDGRRLHHLTGPGRYRALAALLLLAPQSPLLFQGQEFGSSAPFLFFADHNPDLAKLVRKGRAEFLAQFPSIGHANGDLDDPADPRTFERSRLDLGERETNALHYRLYRDLIALRRCDPVLSARDTRMDGAVLDDHAFVLRFFGQGQSDRLLVVNLSRDLALEVAPEPLLAPPNGEYGWRRLWHSEDPCYGGRDATPPEGRDGSWCITGESATLLTSDVD